MALKKFDPDTSRPGEVYVNGEDGDLWQVIVWINDPAAILENTRTGQRDIEIIGCPNAEQWRPVG